MRALLRFGVILLLSAYSCTTFASVETIEIQAEQHLRRVDGIVRDSAGTALPDVHIELLKPKTGVVVANTRSHLDGHFALWHVAPGEYDLRITARGLQPMLYHLKIDRQGSTGLLTVTMKVAT